jgi:hypothetical protein
MFERQPTAESGGFDPSRNEGTRTNYSDPHRKRSNANRSMSDMPLPLFRILKCEAVLPGQKTRAPSPCWRGSTTKPVKWQHMDPDTAKEIYRKAEDFERQTRQPGKQDGAIGRNGLAVLRALIFGFLNYTTGQLDPGYESIAKRACISVRSAARGLVKLKDAGLLNWQRRCTPIIEAGCCVLEQLTNAYALLPFSQWRGYRPSSKRSTPPRPEPGTWGDHPPLPDAITAAITERREGGAGRSVLRALESDATDTLAGALAKLGRALGLAETPVNPDVPA